MLRFLKQGKHWKGMNNLYTTEYRELSEANSQSSSAEQKLSSTTCTYSSIPDRRSTLITHQASLAMITGLGV